MNINFNPQGLTTFAKSLVALFAGLAALWTNPGTHAQIVQFVMAYPHGSQIVGVLALIVAAWGVLHNPVKQDGPAQK